MTIQYNKQFITERLPWQSFSIIRFHWLSQHRKREFTLRFLTVKPFISCILSKHDWCEVEKNKIYNVDENEWLSLNNNPHGFMYSYVHMCHRVGSIIISSRSTIRDQILSVLVQGLAFPLHASFVVYLFCLGECAVWVFPLDQVF